MLVLSRKVGQELVIDGNIRIVVNRVSGNRVTLGITAPDDVRIVRGELEPMIKAFDEEPSDRRQPHHDETASSGWPVDSSSLLADLARQVH